MTWDDIVAISCRWPEVEVGEAYGEPALRVRRRLLARHRQGDDSLVILGVAAEEREHLLAADPAAFFLEPHYVNYDIVLARLPAAPAAIVTRLLETRWRSLASKRAVAAHDG